MRWGKHLRWPSAALVAVLVAIPTPALSTPASQAVKAAFFVKFSNYITWPRRKFLSDSSPIQLCTIGNVGLTTRLETIAASHRADRPLVVRRNVSVAQARGCHLAFVRGTSQQTTQQLIDAIAPSAVLTVTDEAFGTARGHIHFSTNENRIGFFVDSDAAKRHGIELSSQLIALGINHRDRG